MNTRRGEALRITSCRVFLIENNVEVTAVAPVPRTLIVLRHEVVNAAFLEGCPRNILLVGINDTYTLFDFIKHSFTPLFANASAASFPGLPE